jgi:hypothetical protein
MPSTVALFPHLSAVRYLYIWPNETSTLPLELHPRLSRLHSLRYLSIADIKFPSFSALLRLVGAVSSLEELELLRVRWTTACEPDQLPDCKAGFCNIKRVSLNMDYYSHWSLAWIVAAAATGYGYRRSAVVARDPIPKLPPPDIDVLVRASKAVFTCLDIEAAVFEIKHCIEEGNAIFAVCLHYDVDNANLFIRQRRVSFTLGWNQDVCCGIGSSTFQVVQTLLIPWDATAPFATLGSL